MRLIDPEQTTKMLSELYISEDAVNMTGERQGLWVRFRAIEKAVSEIPTIDAVEVVLCTDCRYCKEQGGHANCDGYLYCTWHKTLVDEGRYCSWGERRTA